VHVHLRLRHASYPAPHRPVIPGYRDGLDYIIVEDGRDVGRIYEDRHSKPELRWFWSITVYVNPKLGIITSGRAPKAVLAGADSLMPRHALDLLKSHPVPFFCDLIEQ
jgi:hypothetical protein